MNQINIEIAYCLAGSLLLKSFKVDEGTMIQTAILQSGILQQFTEIDLRENKVGIYSRPAKLTDQLKDGDRIEIYRPLLADPKEFVVNVQQNKPKPHKKKPNKKNRKRSKKMTALSNQYCLPDGMTPEIFLRDYWQKKPLIIRNGLPEIVGQFEPDDIIELAQGEDVTARLVKTFSDDNWKVFFSPLSEDDFADVPEKWSVLIQNLEQWSTELGQLWNKFGFIPQWQRDDIMVSYAPKGGSVGKHYDEYDVFLVQGYGHRRWQLGKWCDSSTEFKPNQPIRIFDDMGELVIDEVMKSWRYSLYSGSYVALRCGRR